MPYSASALSASREWHHQKCSRKSCLLTGCLWPRGTIYAGDCDMLLGTMTHTVWGSARCTVEVADGPPV